MALESGTDSLVLLRDELASWGLVSTVKVSCTQFATVDVDWGNECFAFQFLDWGGPDMYL
jgi:hypothetical protein